MLTPSLFAVYLIHTNVPALSVMKQCEERVFGYCGMGGVSIVMTAIAVFGVALAVDVPRRLLMACLHCGINMKKGSCQ